ncbi:hypothetical protein OTU49_005607 [Cherax quadricarinatus]|uniref:Uncharacterized protein n=1 Tax=Cherax quadricarinatus TaxID=27406 RepID=A0AAW0X7B4_CHEQU
MAKDVLGVNSVINEVPKSKKRHRSRVANEMNTKTVTESYNIVSKFNKKNKKSKQKGNVESKDPLSSEQEPYQKKKKKKGNKNTEGSRKRSHLELNNRETEDAAESIDSGCIADNNSDIAADLTDWPQVPQAKRDNRGSRKVQSEKSLRVKKSVQTLLSSRRNI